MAHEIEDARTLPDLARAVLKAKLSPEGKGIYEHLYTPAEQYLIDEFCRFNIERASGGTYRLAYARHLLADPKIVNLFPDDSDERINSRCFILLVGLGVFPRLVGKQARNFDEIHRKQRRHLSLFQRGEYIPPHLVSPDSADESNAGENTPIEQEATTAAKNKVKEPDVDSVAIVSPEHPSIVFLLSVKEQLYHTLEEALRNADLEARETVLSARLAKLLVEDAELVAQYNQTQSRVKAAQSDHSDEVKAIAQNCHLSRDAEQERLKSKLDTIFSRIDECKQIEAMRAGVEQQIKQLKTEELQLQTEMRAHTAEREQHFEQVHQEMGAITDAIEILRRRGELLARIPFPVETGSEPKDWNDLPWIDLPPRPAAIEEVTVPTTAPMPAPVVTPPVIAQGEKKAPPSSPEQKIVESSPEFQFDYVWKEHLGHSDPRCVFENTEQAAPVVAFMHETGHPITLLITIAVNNGPELPHWPRAVRHALAELVAKNRGNDGRFDLVRLSNIITHHYQSCLNLLTAS